MTDRAQTFEFVDKTAHKSIRGWVKWYCGMVQYFKIGQGTSTIKVPFHPSFACQPRCCQPAINLTIMKPAEERWASPTAIEIQSRSWTNITTANKAVKVWILDPGEMTRIPYLNAAVGSSGNY
jgi:hypothetical protein